MQISQRGDESSNNTDDHDREDHLLVNESLSPHTVGCTTWEETVATSPRSIQASSGNPYDRRVSLRTRATTKIVTTLIDAKLADVTPPPKEPRHPSVFVPPTPSQNKHKDVFGSGDTDVSELSDGSDADSMKALSQKLAARADSLIVITKRASVFADTVSSAGASGKKIVKRRILDSDNEEALLRSRKGAKGGLKPGAGNAKKAVPTAVASNEDGLPTPPALLKSIPSRIPQEAKPY